MGLERAFMQNFQVLRAIVMALPAKEARMDLYGLKTCDTCRKAVKMLEAAQMSIQQNGQSINLDIFD